jgi:type II secretory pathway pseudopilin PulG
MINNRQINATDGMRPSKGSIKSSFGFTLVEAMLAVVLFTMLFGATLLIYISGTESWQANSVRLELQQEVRKSMSRIMDDLREAGTSSVIDVLPGAGWNNTVTFRKAAGISNGVVVWDGNTTSYYVGGTNSDQLIKKIGISTTSVAALNITTVQFRRQSATPDIIEVNLVASKNTFKGRNLSITSNFSIQLRNG